MVETSTRHGMAEAERLIAAGRALYEATKPTGPLSKAWRPWPALSLSEQRRFIDRACDTN
jgi:hypothetical protein